MKKLTKDQFFRYYALVEKLCQGSPEVGKKNWERWNSNRAPRRMRRLAKRLRPDRIARKLTSAIVWAYQKHGGDREKAYRCFAASQAWVFRQEAEYKAPSPTVVEIARQSLGAGAGPRVITFDRNGFVSDTGMPALCISLRPSTGTREDRQMRYSPPAGGTVGKVSVVVQKPSDFWHAVFWGLELVKVGGVA